MSKQRRSIKNRKNQQVLPAATFCPPPPVSSRSFSQMRQSVVDQQRTAMLERPLDEHFYSNDLFLNLMETASQVLSTDPVDRCPVQDTYDSTQQFDESPLNEESCEEFPFSESELPPVPELYIGDFQPVDFSPLARAEFFQHQVERIQVDRSGAAILKSLHRLLHDDSVFRSDFLNHYQEYIPSSHGPVNALDFFFRRLQDRFSTTDFSFHPDRYRNHNLYKRDVYFRNLVEFDETKINVSNEHISRVRFFFNPSSGGKSTFKRNRSKPELYYDVDDMVRDNYPMFLKVQEYCRELDDYGIMNQFWKSTFHIMFPLLYDKILLFNHPNQIPSPYLRFSNMFCIMPVNINYGDKFFDENFYTLLSYKGFKPEHVVFLDYHEYFNYIRDSVYRYF